MLLSGVTLITHGYELTGTFPNWVQTMADAVAAREGGASVYRMVVGSDSSNHVQVQNFYQVSGPDPKTSANGEVVIGLDWAADSTLFLFLTPYFSTTAIANAVVPYLLANALPGLGGAAAQLPFHLIGHSRGGSVVSEMARVLGQSGVWVDQFTTLDPHPVSPDPAAITTSNVVVADNYYETTDFPNGMTVTGAYNLNLTAVDPSHSGVHTYYHGTIDQTATTDGDGSTISPSWYGSPARNATGYVYSRIGGGLRPAIGVGVAFGGTASRVADNAVGAQWANVGRIIPATTTAITGQGLNIAFQYEDRDSASTLYWYLDQDQNPYDGNEIVVGSQAMAATGDTVGNFSATYTVLLGQTGTYYLAAAVSDGTHVRYTYAPARLTIKTPGALGDATLDGTVNMDDYLAVDRGYLLHLTGWSNGDFTGDGAVNAADYAIVDQAFRTLHPSAAPTVAPETAFFTSIATLLDSSAFSENADPPVALMSVVPSPALAPSAPNAVTPATPPVANTEFSQADNVVAHAREVSVHAPIDLAKATESPYPIKVARSMQAPMQRRAFDTQSMVLYASLPRVPGDAEEVTYPSRKRLVSIEQHRPIFFWNEAYWSRIDLTGRRNGGSHA